MNKTKLLRLIMDLMAPRMTDLGYTMSFAKQMFLQKKDKSFTVGYLLVAYDRFNDVNRRSEIVIEPSVYVHYAPIENVYKTITTRNLNNVTNLTTIGGRIANLLANPSGVFAIHNQSLELFNHTEDDANRTAEKLIKYFIEIAQPYFEKNATVEGLNYIFNSNIDSVSVHCLNNEPERALRGIILGKLTGRIDLEDLINKQTKKIVESGNENYEVEFERLMKILPDLKLKA